MKTNKKRAAEKSTHPSSDISPEALRRQTEESLPKIQARLQQVIAFSPTVFYALTPDFAATWVSDNVEAILGYSAAESLSAGWWEEHLHPDDRTHIPAEMRRVFEHGQHTHEYRFQFKDGSYHWIHDQLRLTRDAQGQPLEIIGGWSDISAQMEADAAHRESDERFRVAQDISLQAFTILRSIRDAQGQIVDFEWTYANPMAGRILKNPPDKLMGKRLLELLPGNLENLALFNRYVQIVETGQGDEVELEYRSEGISGWFRNMAVKLGDGVAVSFSDITEHKQAEEKLRESEKQVNSILDNSGVVVFLKDLAGRYITVNRQYEELFHVTRQGVVGKSDYDLFPLESADTYREHDSLALEKGGPVEIEEVVPHDDGLHTYISVKFPLCGADGRPYAVCGIATDITKRKEAEKTIARLATLVDQVPESIVITDLQGKITYVNPAFERISGYTAAEAVGHASGIQSSGLQDEAFYRQLWETINAGEIWKGTFVNKRKDGGLYYEEATITPIKDASGAIINFASVQRDITTRVRMEAELRQAEAKFRNIVETLPGAAYIAEIGELGSFHYVSPQIERLLGYTAQEWISDPTLWVSRIHPDDRALALEYETRASNSGESLMSVEYRMFKCDGRIIWIHDEAVVIRDQAGQPIAWQGVLYDITDRVQTEKALALHHQRLLTVNEISRRISTILDVDQLLGEVVTLIHKQLGYYHVSVILQEGDELVFRANDGDELTPPGFRMQAGQGIVGWVIQEGKPLCVADVTRDEHYVLNPALTQTRSELAVPIRNGERTLGALNLESNRLAAFDESDQNLMQAIANQLTLALANAKSYAEARRQRDEAADLVQVLFDQTDQIVGINRVVAALSMCVNTGQAARFIVDGLRDELGVSKSALWLAEKDELRLTATAGLPNDALAAWQNSPHSDILEVWRDGKRIARARYGKRASADDYFDQWLMLPIKGQGEAAGLLVVEQFSTEEDALHIFLNQAALGLLAARSYTQLLESNLRLEKATQAKTDFMSRMSHELRTPLNAILGFGNMLKDQRAGSLNQKQARQVENIVSSGNHLLMLVNDVLDLAKVEAGKLEVRLEKVALTDAFSGVVSMLAGRAGAKGLEFRTELPDSSLTLTADPLRLRQVLLNLLTNAIKYTERGEVVLRAERADLASLQDQSDLISPVIISIRDTGIGIQLKDFPKIFGQFEQVDNPLTRSQEGTGLGLALTKHLTELMGGRVWFESEYGKGSTFYVLLPQGKPKEEDQP